MALTVLALAAGSLTLVPLGPASAGGGAQEVGDLPALTSRPAPAEQMHTPTGDFSDPPLAPGAPVDQVEAAEQQEAAEPSFDPTTSRPVPELTTSTREVFENIDGSFTAQVAAGPVRFQEGGGWSDIDLTLHEGTAGDLAAEAAPIDVVFPADAPGAVEVGTAAGPLRMGPPDVLGDAADAEVEVEGARASVVGAEGVEARLDLTVRGYEQSLVVPDASSPASYRLTFSLPSQAQARGVPGELVEFTDAEGRLLGRFGGGYAYDSATTGSGEGEVATVATRLIQQSGRQATVEVSISPDWLADPARVFPVVIDPPYQANTASSGADTWAQSQGITASQWSSTELKIGTFNAGATVARSFLRFNNPAGLPAPGVVVSEAHLSLYATQSQSCTTSGIKVQALTSGFDPATVWTNQPAFEPAVTSTTQSNRGGGSGCPAGWVDLDATPLVQRWFDNGPGNNLANLGVVLRAGDETSSNTWKRFASGDGVTTRTPTLNVTYNRYPSAPVQDQPEDEATTPTLSPRLTAQASTDPDGEEVQYWFRVWSEDTNNQRGQVTNSGWIDTPAWRVPPGELADGAEYRWTVFTTDHASWPVQSAVRTFTPTARLGSSGPSAFQAIGPVNVNLATGNANVSVGGPTLPTLGGGAGVGFSYDSQAPALTGLTGRYVNDTDLDRQIGSDELVVAERTDPAVSFVWGDRSPQPGVDNDHFVVRWRGTITVPTTGAYNFGGVHDNGLRVQIGADSSGLEYDEWDLVNPLGGWGSPITLEAGQRYPIRVDYYDQNGPGYVQLMVRPPGTGGSGLQVPSAWLRPVEVPQTALPQGWQMSTGLGGGLVEARVVADAVIFRTASGGWCCAFTRDGEQGTTWRPTQPGTGTMSRADTGRITFHAADGTTYVFRPDGSLSSATSPADSQNPAGLLATYTTVDGEPRLASLADPVSAPADGSPNPRTITFRYGGEGGCPDDEPPEFDDAPPAGMLCEVDYWNNGHVRLYYVNGQLGQVRQPGDVRTDFQYTDGLLSAVRSPLAADAVAAGERTDDAEALTQIEYGTTTTGEGYTTHRVSRVRQPAPTPGAPRPDATIQYTAGTKVLVAGAPQPNGYTRLVHHDTEGRTLVDRGPDGLGTSTTWDDDDDRPVSVLGPTGLRTNTAYDPFGRVTTTWGPAPDSWFGGASGAPTSHVDEVPTSTQAYDEGVTGLAMTWWNNVSLSGPPDLFAHGQPNQQWGINGPAGLTGGPGGAAITDNFSGRMTGMIDVPSEGDFDFQVVRDGKVRVMLDDEPLVDSWSASTAVAPAEALHLTAGTHPIMLEYAETTGSASVRLEWRQKNADGTWPVFAPVPAGVLLPGYGNVTRSVGVDGQLTAQTYTAPHLRSVSSATTGAVEVPHPAVIETAAEYEDGSVGHFRRQTAGTAPSGAEVATTYYGTGGKPAKKDNPCTDGSTPVHQGGQVATITDPTAADGSTRVEEYIYDTAGRRAAERLVGETGWTCTTYDSRGRPEVVEIPAFGGQPGRTITTDYAVDGNPLLSSVDDDTPGTTTGGRSETEVDLLGRVIRTVDVWGLETTTVYDQLGRAVSSTGEGGTITNTYGDPQGRLTSVAYNGEQIATVTYSGPRLSSVSYPSGPDKAGNGTSLAPLEYDAYDRVSSMEWRTPSGGLLTSNSRTLTHWGDATAEAADGQPFATYQYDGIGRLVSASVAGQQHTYGFGTADAGFCSGTGFSATAGRNTNRTSMTVGGDSTRYCYDAADRLIKTDAEGIGTDITYDSRGNVTELGEQELAYDSSDRHIATTDSGDGSTVTYLRDASGAIVQREETGKPTLRYSSGPAGVALTMDEGGILERVLSLPGGASVTVRADEEVWSYPNLQGSVAATADGQGAKTGGTFTYDPFGRPLNGHPDNREGDLDGGWLGSVGREGGAGGGLIEMGARVHSPLLGRFLQVDPVRGGSANDYDYTNGDPINFTDRTGTDPRPHYRCRLRGTCSTPNISGTFRFGLHRGLSFPNHLKGWETGPVWLRAQKLDAANRRFNQYLAFMAQDLRLRTWQQEVAAQNAIRRRQAGAVAAAFAEPLRPSQPLPDNPCHGFMCTGWKPDVLGDIVSCLEWGAVFAVSGPGLAAQVGVPGVGTVVTTGTGCVTGIVLNEAVDMPPNLP